MGPRMGIEVLGRRGRHRASVAFRVPLEGCHGRLEEDEHSAAPSRGSCSTREAIVPRRASGVGIRIGAATGDAA